MELILLSCTNTLDASHSVTPWERKGTPPLGTSAAGAAGRAGRHIVVLVVGEWEVPEGRLEQCQAESWAREAPRRVKEPAP